MSDSASSPSSSETPPSQAATNSTKPSETSPPPPPPPEDSTATDDVLSLDDESASPPSNTEKASSPPQPTPTLSPPPKNSSSPPPSPPPSSPPPSSSPPHSPSPTTNSNPPAVSPPPELLSSSSQHVSPPPSTSSPTPKENVSPSVSSQSSPPPPDNTSLTKLKPPGEFIPPPASPGTVKSPTLPTELIAPPPPVSNSASTTSNSNVTDSSSTASLPTQSTSSNAKGSSSGNSSSTSSTSEQSYTTSTNSTDNTTTKVLIGAVMVGAVLIAILAIFFALMRRKKRRDPYTAHYTPPKNFAVQTDGYYYGQIPQFSPLPGQTNNSYSSQISQSPDSYESPNNFGESGIIGGIKTNFSYEEVMEMTNGFSRQNIIGEGGFGCVYKGQASDGRAVAVKQLKLGSGQGDREFKAEVEIISRVHHRHLVSLVGYCICDKQRLLLYEYVPNKTLEHHLHAKGMPVLDWPKRLKIALGAAKGLAYLHEDCNPRIIHRDIKSANILLEDNFEAQVADFGLARLNDTSQSHVSTRVMGTFGYLAPEYASSGKLTDRSDVYSFGVVLLELITGRKPVDTTQPMGDESLVEWARPLLIQAIETGDLGEVVDPRLGKQYVESELFRMVETAAACVRHSAPKRPRMVQVVRALDSESMSDLTNGVKYGQSTAYDSGQYNEDIMRFRKMAFSDDSSEFDTDVGREYSSREVSNGPPVSNFTSIELETEAMRESVDKR